MQLASAVRLWLPQISGDAEQPAAGATARWSIGVVTVLVLVFAAAATAAAYVVGHQHVAATEERLLEEQALQGTTAFESVGQQIESIVAASGAIAEASDGDPTAFIEAMTPRADQTLLSSVVLLRVDGPEVGTIAQVGRNDAVLLPGLDARVLGRIREIAAAGTLEVVELTTLAGDRVLGFAAPANPGSEYVTYAELVLPEVLVETSDVTPDVGFAVYIGSREDPANLIVASHLPGAPGKRIERLLPAGDETMLLIYTATRPLASATTRALPWMALAGGIVFTLFLAGIVELGRRRRLRAVALVGIVEAKNEQLNLSEERYRELFDNANDFVFLTDARDRIESVNAAGVELTGFAQSDLEGVQFSDLVSDSTRGTADAMRDRKLSGEVERTTYQVELATKSGALVPVELSTRLVRHGDEIIGVQGIGRDIRVRKQLEARFRWLVQNSSDVIFVVGPTGVISYQSPSTKELLGYDSEELISASIVAVVHEADREALLAFLSATGSEGGVVRTDVRVRTKDRAVAHVELVANNLLEDPTVEGIVVTLHDVTERKALEAQLSYQAFHDPLTALANRALFLDRVEHALEQRARFKGELAVLFLDLDDFKTVNDSLGHERGDQLLKAIGGCLRGTLRTGDTCARLGGDEFAILLHSFPDRAFVTTMAERLLESLAEPLALDDREVTVRVSVGIAVAAGGSIEADDLLRNADAAMYTAKREGRGCARFFETDMHTAALARLDLKNELEGALARDEFELHYQPIVSIADGTIEVVEALLRWNHPVRGPMMPADFVPLAEETGLIVPIGKWVLEQACRDARAWPGLVPPGAVPPRISVNVAARQLQQASFVGEVADVLSETGTDPRNVVLEITESALVRNTGEVVERLEDLRALGIRIAVDDFGTGYSSLSYLEEFPVDVLKIAQPFIDSILRGDEESLAGAIVRLGGTLALETVAEGVETAEQLAQLTELGCEMGQGYHFARPLTSERLSEFLRNGVDEGAVAASGDVPAELRDAA